MLNQQLESCPFCKGEAIIVTDNGSCRGMCLDCGATGQAAYYSTRGWLKHAYQEAQELWNRRVSKENIND